jgi:hypothetical protein
MMESLFRFRPDLRHRVVAQPVSPSQNSIDRHSGPPDGVTSMRFWLHHDLPALRVSSATSGANTALPPGRPSFGGTGSPGDASLYPPLFAHRQPVETKSRLLEAHCMTSCAVMRAREGRNPSCQSPERGGGAGPALRALGGIEYRTHPTVRQPRSPAPISENGTPK